MHGWYERPSRQARGYGAMWDKLRIAILKRDRYLCQACLGKGRVTAATEVDHIVAKSAGGTDEPGNLQAICHPCHQAKSDLENGKRPKVQIGLDGWPADQ